jgi:putative tryptophan/tyrosine transport system substrate-binding protein
MKFLKSLKFIKTLTACVVALTLESQAHSKVIAITQIAPHPSLDQIRQGILDELEQQKISKQLIFDNAQGNMGIAMQIAQKFLSKNPDIVIPITTPSAQSVCTVFKDSQIPIVFSAVTDPQSAKIIGEGGSKNVTGLSDQAPVQQQLQLIKDLLPNAKKIAVLFNMGESNSTATLEKIKALAPSLSLEILEAPCSQTAEVATVSASLIGRADAIFIPNDNLVISALEAVLKVAEGKVPVFASDPESVAKGCLAAVAYDQYQLGRQTGKIVAKILQGKPVSAIPVETPDQVQLLVNLKTAKALDITIPEFLRFKNTQFIGG